MGAGGLRGGHGGGSVRAGARSNRRGALGASCKTRVLFIKLPRGDRDKIPFDDARDKEEGNVLRRNAIGH